VRRSVGRTLANTTTGWDRDGKEFEYLCKHCHRACCTQNRDGLEDTLVAAGAGRTDRRSFLRQYCERLADGTERD